MSWPKAHKWEVPPVLTYDGNNYVPVEELVRGGIEEFVRLHKPLMPVRARLNPRDFEDLLSTTRTRFSREAGPLRMTRRDGAQVIIEPDEDVKAGTTVVDMGW